MNGDLIVYARGKQRGFSLDGGQLAASTRLDQTQPPLDSQSIEASAAGKHNDRSALNARAKAWFAQDARRFRYAVNRDSQAMRIELARYLNGKR